MQAELLNQDFSDGVRKTQRVRVKKKVRVRIKLDSRKEKARKKRKERIIVFFLIFMVLAFIGALLLMKYGGGEAPAPEQIPYPG